MEQRDLSVLDKWWPDSLVREVEMDNKEIPKEFGRERRKAFPRLYAIRQLKSKPLNCQH